MREKWRAREIDALGKKYRYKDTKKRREKRKRTQKETNKREKECRKEIMRQ